MSETKPAEDTTADNYEDAFSRLAELGDKPVTAEVLAGVEPEVKPEPEPVVTEPAKEPDPVAEDPAKEPEVKPEPEPAKTPEPGIQDVISRLDALKPTPEPAKPAAPAPEAPLYTADEETFLNKYVEDWPDVVKAEALIRRAEYKQLMNFVFAEVAKHLTPVMQTVDTLAERTQLSDLRSGVEDYDTIRDKVVDWVATQPAYLRSAYENVIQNGTTEEALDLISRYRSATGDTAKPAPAAAEPMTRKKDTELPAATKQAVAALAPVSSKRSATIQTTDPQDYEAAFEEAAKV